jgi:hypothetical protein
MKKYMAAVGTLCLLSGCLHSQPEYPGAFGASIEPAKYVNSTCPDLSGIYEGNGHLVSGDARAKQFARTHFFDSVFPISDWEQWRDVQKKYRVYDYRRIFVPADFVVVSNLKERSVLVEIHYSDSPIGSLRSDFIDKSKFVCIDGRLVWGGKDSINGRSEWGSNTGSRTFAIYKDAEGNLMYERNQQVNMNILFGIPAGTAEYFSIYRFKKTVRPN